MNRRTTFALTVLLLLAAGPTAGQQAASAETLEWARSLSAAERADALAQERARLERLLAMKEALDRQLYSIAGPEVYECIMAGPEQARQCTERALARQTDGGTLRTRGSRDLRLPAMPSDSLLRLPDLPGLGGALSSEQLLQQLRSLYDLDGPRPSARRLPRFP